jgi:hypothetical protein
MLYSNGVCCSSAQAQDCKQGVVNHRLLVYHHTLGTRTLAAESAKRGNVCHNQSVGVKCMCEGRCG